MADEHSPSNPGSSFPKKETVRITLPPRITETPGVKRETVRIAQNTSADKGQTIRIQPKTGEPQPKKETTKIVSLGSLPPPPKPAAIPVPPAPAPAAAAVPPKPPGVPIAPPKPPTGAFSMPPAKPSIAPIVPPAPPVSAPPAPPMSAPPAPVAPAPVAPAAPLAPKPNAPKRETSRIQIPAPTSRLQQMPKATVKLQQTQPLPQGPAASVIKTTTLTTSTGPIPATAEDPLVLVASIIVFIGSAAAAVLSYLTFSSCA